jgi:hypothetical protein
LCGVALDALNVVGKVLPVFLIAAGVWVIRKCQ